MKILKNSYLNNGGMMGKPTKKAPLDKQTEPEVNSNFNTISAKPGKMSTEILADMGVVAFRYCKELVPLLARLAWKIHILENHSSDKQSEAYLMEGCGRLYCAPVRDIVARMNKDLFFGTLDMEDLTAEIIKEL